MNEQKKYVQGEEIISDPHHQEKQKNGKQNRETCLRNQDSAEVSGREAA